MKPSEIEYHVGSVSGKFRLLGFATGSYSCTCSTCEKEFIGDKRASMCLECAIDRAEELSYMDYTMRPAFYTSRSDISTGCYKQAAINRSERSKT